MPNSPTQLSPENRQLVLVVASDLRFIREEWDNAVDDDSLRRTSTVLRRLLVEGDLQKAWKAAGLGGQATVRAASLDGILSVFPAHRIEFAAAGGASFKGAQLRGPLSLRFKITPQQEAALFQAGLPDREYRLLEFIDAVSLIAEGKPIRRRHIVKYVANKLGGAHLDSRRAQRKDDAIFALLDRASSTYAMLDKPAVYFELLSIGQALAGSKDLQRLEAVAAAVANPKPSA